MSDIKAINYYIDDIFIGSKLNENNIIEFNLYVSSVSEFENWDEMVEEALLSLLTLPE